MAVGEQQLDPGEWTFDATNHTWTFTIGGEIKSIFSLLVLRDPGTFSKTGRFYDIIRKPQEGSSWLVQRFSRAELKRLLMEGDIEDLMEMLAARAVQQVEGEGDGDGNGS